MGEELYFVKEPIKSRPCFITEEEYLKITSNKTTLLEDNYIGYCNTWVEDVEDVICGKVSLEIKDLLTDEYVIKNHDIDEILKPYTTHVVKMEITERKPDDLDEDCWSESLGDYWYYSDDVDYVAVFVFIPIEWSRCEQCQ